MTNERLSDLFDFKYKIREHLGSLRSPCIWSKSEILAVFGPGNNSNKVLIFPKAQSLSEAAKVLNFNLQASKVDIYD